ncbi:MAG: hypothetical protein K6V97_08635 [Actinomycetia bacterium]|nr:hypothetical protein [Actinomycetes bacterium]
MSVAQAAPVDKAVVTQLVQATWETWWAQVVAAGVPTDLAAIEQAVAELVQRLGQLALAAAGVPAGPRGVWSAERPCGVSIPPGRSR